ncbi:MAG: hypothetical protein H6759_05075 [Candidatus Nomurabacteria bacterium]|nr:MAG: hypothetical protein H6759_05075 [Candidatus Nomurabacteria bacterium]
MSKKITLSICAFFFTVVGAMHFIDVPNTNEEEIAAIKNGRICHRERCTFLNGPFTGYVRYQVDETGFIYVSNGTAMN